MAKDLAVDEKAILLLMNDSFDVYINTEDGHYKFWAVRMHEKESTYRWGKIGTKMQELVKNYSSTWETKRAVEDKIQEKLNKGYKKL
jgi:predicted DNA-binding WGR domain protein